MENQKSKKKISRSANSVFIYGIYIVFVGVAFLLFPNTCLHLLGMKTATEIWIHVAGWFGIWLGIYYIVSALSESKAFILTTVYGRPTFICFLGVLVYLGMIEPSVLIIGAIDVITAIWTYLLLRSEKSSSSLTN
jgi:hypothetical protein